MELNIFGYYLSSSSRAFQNILILIFRATSQDGYNDSVFFFLCTVYFCLLTSVGSWRDVVKRKWAFKEDNSIINYSVQ